MLNGKELSKYKLKCALVQVADNIKLELLQIVEGKSVEQDWLKRHGKSVNHVCIKSDDVEKEAKKWVERGIEILQEDHRKWIYLDTEDILGFDLEILPNS